MVLIVILEHIIIIIIMSRVRPWQTSFGLVE